MLNGKIIKKDEKKQDEMLGKLYFEMGKLNLDPPSVGRGSVSLESYYFSVDSMTDKSIFILANPVCLSYFALDHFGFYGHDSFKDMKRCMKNTEDLIGLVEANTETEFAGKFMNRLSLVYFDDDFKEHFLHKSDYLKSVENDSPVPSSTNMKNWSWAKYEH